MIRILWPAPEPSNYRSFFCPAAVMRRVGWWCCITREDFYKYNYKRSSSSSTRFGYAFVLILFFLICSSLSLFPTIICCWCYIAAKLCLHKRFRLEKLYGPDIKAKPHPPPEQLRRAMFQMVYSLIVPCASNTHSLACRLSDSHPSSCFP
jgi:hypothetical protein